MFEFLQYISIFLEIIIALFGVLIVFKKKQNYGWGIFITFAIYTYYDLAKHLEITITPDFLYILFFIASVSIFLVTLKLYKN